MLGMCAMPELLGSVFIVEQDGSDIFIDGHSEPDGKAPGPFILSYGTHSFETRDTRGRTAARAVVTVKSPDTTRLSLNVVAGYA